MKAEIFDLERITQVLETTEYYKKGEGVYELRIGKGLKRGLLYIQSAQKFVEFFTADGERLYLEEISEVLINEEKGSVKFKKVDETGRESYLTVWRDGGFGLLRGAIVKTKQNLKRR